MTTVGDLRLSPGNPHNSRLDKLMQGNLAAELQLH